MDCKTARLLLDFVRSTGGGQATELDAVEWAAFEGHLSLCPECDALARSERAVDLAFRKAMTAVEVPAGLRNRLLNKLDAQRDDRHRRWLGHASRIVAAAAAIVLLVWGAQAWRWAQRPTVDVNRAWDDVHARHISPPGRDDLQADYKRWGIEAVLPADLNYSLLAYHGVGEFEGRRVPQLIFVPRQGGAHAEVRVLSAQQFDLRDLPVDYQSPAGYDYKVEVWKDKANQYAGLVVYSGGSADWLRQEFVDDAGTE